MKPDAGERSKYMDLDRFIFIISHIRCFKHQVHTMCPEPEASLGSQLQFHPLYFNIFRHGEVCRQHSECASDSFWAMVRNLYNFKI
jgi:hypothetical protein